MNRDEKRDRFAALAPAVVELEGRRAIFPREPAGGTWIAVNDAGVCLALINWHRIEREPNYDVLSRGLIIRELVGKCTTDEIAAALRKLPLRKFRPFRLIAISPDTRRLTEWRWNVGQLMRRDHQWQRQHWFSSGFDEQRAALERAKVCLSFVAGGGDSGSRNTFCRCSTAGVDATGYSSTAGVDVAGYSLSTLRRLHRSHLPKRGAFSICMHRPDAATVSYTEIGVSEKRATMRYKPGPVCAATATTTRTLPIRWI
jgi:hypothetical protein